MTVMILGIVAAGLYAVRKWDEPLPLRGGMYLVILTAAFAQAALIQCLAAGEPPGARLMFCVTGGCLLFASVTDHAICQVYQFTWWPVLIVVLPEVWKVRRDAAVPLLLFLFLQFAVFGRMYGRADCYGFCVCAAVEAVRGEKLAGYMLHMLLAWLLLLFVQIVRGNVGRDGKLKKPVPFLPYITASFWLVMAYNEKYKFFGG